MKAYVFIRISLKLVVCDGALHPRGKVSERNSYKVLNIEPQRHVRAWIWLVGGGKVHKQGEMELEKNRWLARVGNGREIKAYVHSNLVWLAGGKKNGHFRLGYGGERVGRAGLGRKREGYWGLCK